MAPLPVEVQIGIRAAVCQMRLEELTLSYRAADRALVELHTNAEQTVRERFGMGPDEVFEYPIDIPGTGRNGGQPCGDKGTR